MAQTYKKSLPLDGSVAYLSKDTGALKRLTSGGLQGLRSYLLLPVGAQVKLVFNGIETGINTIDGSQILMNTDPWFTLSGARISGQPTQKGVYMQRGNKVLVK